MIEIRAGSEVGVFSYSKRTASNTVILMFGKLLYAERLFFVQLELTGVLKVLLYA